MKHTLIVYVDTQTLSNHTVGMATRAQIIEVRVRINDPEGYESITDVADSDALPAIPAPYTTYYLTDTGAYVATDLTSGATASDYDRLDIRVSDSRITSWIDTYSVDQAECRALSAIATRLGGEFRIMRSRGGAEETEWTALRDAYQYYRSLADECSKRHQKDDNKLTGRYGTSDQPEIAGGEV